MFNEWMNHGVPHFRQEETFLLPGKEKLGEWEHHVLRHKRGDVAGSAHSSPAGTGMIYCLQARTGSRPAGWPDMPRECERRLAS